MSKKLILLAGPTASGKSNLAIKLAKKINGEIINADSMQVFKEFTVLSSRPDSSQIGNVKHHLYGIISVKKHFSAGDWLKQAKKNPILFLICWIWETGTSSFRRGPRFCANLAIFMSVVAIWTIHAKNDFRGIFKTIKKYCRAMLG